MFKLFVFDSRTGNQPNPCPVSSLDNISGMAEQPVGSEVEVAVTLKHPFPGCPISHAKLHEAGKGTTLVLTAPRLKHIEENRWTLSGRIAPADSFPEPRFAGRAV